MVYSNVTDVTVLGNPTLSLSASVSNIVPGTSTPVTLSGTLTSNGSAVPSAPIEFWYQLIASDGTKTGWASYSGLTATTDANGNYTVTTNIDQPASTKTLEIVSSAYETSAPPSTVGSVMLGLNIGAVDPAGTVVALGALVAGLVLTGYAYKHRR
jgi:hypothetical protein